MDKRMKAVKRDEHLQRPSIPHGLSCQKEAYELMQERLQEKFQEVNRLFQMVHSQQCSAPSKVSAVLWKFEAELDTCINNMEDVYYTHFLKNKKTDALVNEMEESIAITKKTMNVFLPYMIMYNLMGAGNGRQVDM